MPRFDTDAVLGGGAWVQHKRDVEVSAADVACGRGQDTTCGDVGLCPLDAAGQARNGHTDVS